MLLKTGFNLLKNFKTSFKYVPIICQSSLSSLKDDHYIIKPSNYKPGHDEYNNIPINVDGVDYVINNEHISYPYPNVPFLSEETDESYIDSSKELEEKNLEDELCIWFGETMPTILDEKHPERDTLNYPRENFRLLNIPKTRYFLIPDSYFKFFESKTGVTGGYMFALSLSTLLISKEYFLLGEVGYEFLVFYTLCIIIAKKFSYVNPKLTANILKELQGWADWRSGMIDFLKKYITTQKDNKKKITDQLMLFDAKRNCVYLQREIEYRERLKKVYDEVKKKLDYQVAIEEAEKHLKQKNLVKWVIDNVNKSIDSNLDKIVLQKCISDLKNLSQKRKYVL